jgi:ABC-type glycerol-3-phosphate transport system permease component
MNYLLALTVNLAGMFLIYSLMADALLRLSWHRRGMIPVLAAIIIAGQFWIVPALIVRHSTAAGVASYSFSYCNWLISGFSIIVLCQAVRWIPRQLEDSARLDGCGRFGTYWHVLLPLVRRELGLIGFLTLIGTSVLLATPLVVFDGGFLTQWLARLQPVWRGGLAPTGNIGLMMGASLVATLPIIVVFFFAKRHLQTTSAGGTGAVPSRREDATAGVPPTSH